MSADSIPLRDHHAVLGAVFNSLIASLILFLTSPGYNCIKLMSTDALASWSAISLYRIHAWPGIDVYATQGFAFILSIGTTSSSLSLAALVHVITRVSLVALKLSS